MSEVLSGGVPKDGIPAIDGPKFVSASAASKWLGDREPVVALTLNGDSRAYPLQILIWHEIVNDVVGGVPVAVSFCPLCNTAIAFERTLNGVVYDFGVSGLLRFSDLVMYDRQTESWWQQVTGEAIVGDLTGKVLRPLPASIVSWRDFRLAYPSSKVLSQDTGYERDYGRNPYVGYDDIEGSPFLFYGSSDPRLRPMERVVAIEHQGVAKAYPFNILAHERAVNDEIGDLPVVVVMKPGTTSALNEASIAASRDVGSGIVFERRVGGRVLTFVSEGTSFRDVETGSFWNVFGLAFQGQLAGQQLTPVLHGNHFWFVWSVFKPSTQVYQGAKVTPGSP